MAQTTTTRRDLLRFGTSAAAYAAGAAIVTGGIALAGEAKGSKPAVSSGLIRLIAEADRLAAASDAHHYNVYEPARERMLGAVEKAQLNLPHTSIDMGSNASGQPLVWTTASSTNVAVAKTLARRKNDPGHFEPGYVASARRLVAAHLRRERTIGRIKRSHDIGAIVEQSNAICDATAEAEERVAAFPASTLADLHAKVAFMHRRNMGDGMDRLTTMLADLDRLATGGEA